MISILIPVYNEELVLRQNVNRLTEWLSKRPAPFEIIVVDNGSTDQSEAIGRDLEKTNSKFRYFRIPEKSVGKAFAKGVREARFPYVISMDADLSVELEFIGHAEVLLKDGAMVVGSKTLGRQKRSFVRVVGSQVYLMVTQVLFGMTITDFSMGAKGYRRELILPILDEIDTWTAYVFEICVWLIRASIRSKRPKSLFSQLLWIMKPLIRSMTRSTFATSHSPSRLKGRAGSARSKLEELT